MATTTKSPKAKTKTSNAKTSARATTKKTAPKKSRSTKSSSAKADSKSSKATKSAKVSRFSSLRSGLSNRKTKKTISLESLRKLNWFSACLFLVLAVAAWFVMGDDTSQLTIGHLSKDVLASSDNNDVLVSANRVFYDLQLRWLVVTILALSVIKPLLSATRLQNRYNKFLKDSRMEPSRWIDFGVTFGLIVATTALLSGTSDVFVLKMVVDLIIISAMASLIAERQNNSSEKMVWSGFAVSLFSGVVPWLLIGSAAIATVVYGAVSSPWYVYVLYFVVVLSFLLNALIQWKQYRRKGSSTDYLNVERNYLVLNVLTKTAFAVALVVGLNGINAVS